MLKILLHGETVYFYFLKNQKDNKQKKNCVIQQENTKVYQFYIRIFNGKIHNEGKSHFSEYTEFPSTN